MPIRPENRGFYPIDWPQLSHVIRFDRAGGRCERCARPHGERIWHLGEQVHGGNVGVWWDRDKDRWRNEKGRAVRLPPLSVVYNAALRQGWLWVGLVPDERLVAASGLRRSLVVLACCHLDHDSFNNASANLAALCQRCHLKHDATDNLARRRANRWTRMTRGMERLALV